VLSAEILSASSFEFDAQPIRSVTIKCPGLSLRDREHIEQNDAGDFRIISSALINRLATGTHRHQSDGFPIRRSFYAYKRY